MGRKAGAVVLWAAVALQAPAAATSLYAQPRYAAFLADAETGEVLYARQADAPRFPASITKVMTLYVVFERLAAGQLRRDDRVVVSARAAGQPPSKLGLKAGDSLSLDEAIRALTVKSANDVAVAVAEHVAGSEEAFARLMTLKARQLGMVDTRFVNASGLPDPRQLTTARDLGRLAVAVWRDFPQYYGYFTLPHFAFRGQVMANHNHLLRTTPGVDGIKTGYTGAAGFTLAASAVRDGRRLIAVVLGGPSRVARDANVEALLSSGFAALAARARGVPVQVADLMAEPGDLNDFVLQRLVEQGSGDPRAERDRR
ncbi:MAG: D-alanyl-D-alanine carboxypeptidase [Sphingomonadaceae bacterium]|uniref:D-alanyl-D-alanine carboxypeptidase family protein n=1 Tax=Thermaurantiacus sp. TaxID=2820283 RepID=UPI00298F2809|nr:D-alanyl-D-alanine carboxypeptidase family protein [Thermaurantiacus sp.]MCS6986882.1 D-alanyl-D-alanine carboxypeptidase [Sphingomonadaceae bacterium]MDW8415518.1 D-alanyl-D-alanine carboxypeptidase family protein [Thermaurantiacus sp.]